MGIIEVNRREENLNVQGTGLGVQGEGISAAK